MCLSWSSSSSSCCLSCVLKCVCLSLSLLPGFIIWNTLTGYSNIKHATALCFRGFWCGGVPWWSLSGLGTHPGLLSFSSVPFVFLYTPDFAYVGPGYVLIRLRLLQYSERNAQVDTWISISENNQQSRVLSWMIRCPLNIVMYRTTDHQHTPGGGNVFLKCLIVWLFNVNV